MWQVAHVEMVTEKGIEMLQYSAEHVPASTGAGNADIQPVQ